MENKEIFYEIWVLGYDKDGEATDFDMDLGEFKDPQEAIEHARKFKDATYVLSADELYYLREEGTDYLELRVEACFEDEDEDERMNSVIPFQLAYAVSIHKAQGLEYDSVSVLHKFGFHYNSLSGGHLIKTPLGHLLYRRCPKGASFLVLVARASNRARMGGRGKKRDG